MNRFTWLIFFMLLVPASAQATPTFPRALDTDIPTQFTPDCSVCHANGVTGFGTVTTPFGAAMRARGLVAGDLNALRTAVEALRAEATDSDGDGIPDISELEMGTDPNLPTGSKPMIYGCISQVATGARASSNAIAWAAFALAFAGVVRARNRQRKAQQ